MTLEDLKKRATASELTLIEATEANLRDGVARELLMSIGNFMRENQPPSREEARFNGHNVYTEWFARMLEHLNIPNT